MPLATPGALPVCSPLPCTYNLPDAVGLEHNCSNITSLEGTYDKFLCTCWLLLQSQAIVFFQMQYICKLVSLNVAVFSSLGSEACSQVEGPRLICCVGSRFESTERCFLHPDFIMKSLRSV